MRSRALIRAATGALFVLLSLTVYAPREARADGEAWLWFEYRLPVVAAQGGPARWPRVDVRLFTDVRLNARSNGLAQTFFRVGPLVYFTPWLFVAAHGTINANRLAGGLFQTEVRAELEPNFFFRAGPFTVNDRNRVEYRWRSNSASSAESFYSVRYRNQLRVNYAPVGARLIPFVWDELLIDSTEGVHQNRAMAGLGVMLNAHTRLEAGYLLRSRRDLATGAWTHDHVANIYLFVDVPPLVPPPAPLPPPPATPAPVTDPAVLPPPSTSATPELPAPPPSDGGIAPAPAR